MKWTKKDLENWERLCKSVQSFSDVKPFEAQIDKDKMEVLRIINKGDDRNVG